MAVSGDQRQRWPVRTRQILGQGHVSSFVDEVVESPSGARLRRQFTTHPGAVAILAWDEHRDEIATVRQYRHPVGMELIEIPAGLLDVVGEDWLLAAQRELAEEAELGAQRWDVLVDMVTSPGASEESLRIFLARDLHPVDRPDGFELEGEEAFMTAEFVGRTELIDGIFAGRCQSPTLVAGVLALETARLTGSLERLRSVSAPWPIRQ